jgi:hypothetical protein
MWKELDGGFPTFDNNPKNLHNIANKEFLNERIFSKLSVIKTQLRTAMLEERLNYLSIVSVENNTKKPLLCEDAIIECAAKTCRKKSSIEVSQAVA